MTSLETDHIPYIQRAIVLANQAVEHGNHPFGSLLVLDGNNVLESENTVITEKDITRHAELNLVSKATKVYSADVLKRATLYTSTEPCAMCSGSIYWAGIGRVVFACSTGLLAEIAGDPFAIPCKEIFQRGGHEVVVDGPILEEEASQIHRVYWK